MTREEELLVLRAWPLTFGVFAQIEDSKVGRIARSGGRVFSSHRFAVLRRDMLPMIYLTLIRIVRINSIEERVRTLQDENELLYGKLSQRTTRRT